MQEKNVKYVESLKDPLVGWYDILCCDKCGWKFHNRAEKHTFCEACGTEFYYGELLINNAKSSRN